MQSRFAGQFTVRKGMNMDMENKSCGKKQKGIVCDVQSCVYHAKDNCCTASEILVGPKHASSSSETACVTFKPADCGDGSCK